MKNSDTLDRIPKRSVDVVLACPPKFDPANNHYVRYIEQVTSIIRYALPAMKTKTYLWLVAADARQDGSLLNLPYMLLTNLESDGWMVKSHIIPVYDDMVMANMSEGRLINVSVEAKLNLLARVRSSGGGYEMWPLPQKPNRSTLSATLMRRILLMSSRGLPMNLLNLWPDDGTVEEVCSDMGVNCRTLHQQGW